MPEWASQRHMFTAFPAPWETSFPSAPVTDRAPRVPTRHARGANRGQCSERLPERETHRAQMMNPEKAIITTDQIG